MVEIPDSAYIAIGLGVAGGLFLEVAKRHIDFACDYFRNYREVISLARKIRDRNHRDSYRKSKLE